MALLFFPILPLWIYLLMGVLGLAFVVWLDLRQDKIQSRDMEALSPQLGMKFIGSAVLDGLEGDGATRLFRRRGHVENAMLKAGQPYPIVLFEYSYQKGRDTVNQTAVASRVNVPAFELRPARNWHRLAAVFGYQKLGFDSHPRFARNFLLRGKHEQSAEAAFTPRVLDFFDQLSNEWDWCVESNGQWLTVYRDNKPLKFRREGCLLENTFSDHRVHPKNIPEFLERATAIVNAFSTAQK